MKSRIKKSIAYFTTDGKASTNQSAAEHLQLKIDVARWVSVNTHLKDTNAAWFESLVNEMIRDRKVLVDILGSSKFPIETTRSLSGYHTDDKGRVFGEGHTLLTNDLDDSNSPSEE